MVNPMIIILVIGIISAVFGALLIFAPEAILKAERQANRLFMTDTVFLKNRIPIGIGLLGASAFLGYTYAAKPLNEIIFLVTAVLAGVFGLLLLVSPNTILQAERHANKLYMTDAYSYSAMILLRIYKSPCVLFEESCRHWCGAFGIIRLYGLDLLFIFITS